MVQAGAGLSAQRRSLAPLRAQRHRPTPVINFYGLSWLRIVRILFVYAHEVFVQIATHDICPIHQIKKYIKSRFIKLFVKKKT